MTYVLPSIASRAPIPHHELFAFKRLWHSPVDRYKPCGPWTQRLFYAPESMLTGGKHRLWCLVAYEDHV